MYLNLGLKLRHSRSRHINHLEITQHRVKCHKIIYPQRCFHLLSIFQQVVDISPVYAKQHTVFLMVKSELKNRLQIQHVEELMF